MLIMTPGGLPLEAEVETTEDGEAIYRVAYVTADGDVPGGAFVFSVDARLEPKPGRVSVRYGLGGVADRHQRTEVPQFGESLFLVGERTFEPSAIGEDGSGLRVRAAMTPTGSHSTLLDEGSEAQLRAGDVVAALAAHFVTREDFAQLARLHATHMAPARLQAPTARLAELDRRMTGLRIERQVVAAKVGFLTALLTPAETGEGDGAGEADTL